MSDVTSKVSEKMENLAKLVDNEIEGIAGERIGFTLVVYTPGRASYVSNVEREDTIRELNDLVKYLNNGMPDVKAHEVQ